MAKSKRPGDKSAGANPHATPLEKAIDRPIGQPERAREEAPIGWIYGPDGVLRPAPEGDAGADRQTPPAHHSEDGVLPTAHTGEDSTARGTPGDGGTAQPAVAPGAGIPSIEDDRQTGGSLQRQREGVSPAAEGHGPPSSPGFPTPQTAPSFTAPHGGGGGGAPHPGATHPGHTPPLVEPPLRVDVPPPILHGGTPNLVPGHTPPVVEPPHRVDVPPPILHGDTPNLVPGHTPPVVEPPHRVDVPPPILHGDTPNLVPGHTPPVVEPPHRVDVPPPILHGDTPNLVPGHTPPLVEPPHRVDVPPPTLGNDKTPNLVPGHTPPLVEPPHRVDVPPPTLGNDKTPNLVPGHTPPVVEPPHRVDVPPPILHGGTPNLVPGHTPPVVEPPHRVDVPPPILHGDTPNLVPGHTPPLVEPPHRVDVPPPTLGNDKTPNLVPGHTPPLVEPPHRVDVPPPTLGNDKTPNLVPGHTPPVVEPPHRVDVPPPILHGGTPNLVPGHTPPVVEPPHRVDVPPPILHGDTPNLVPGHTPPLVEPPHRVDVPPPTLGNDKTPNIVPHIAQIGGVDTATVTEDRNVTAGHLTTGGTLTIADADPGEAAFTPVTSGAGHYGTFTVDAQGHWTYSADNSQAAVQQLAPGQHLTETLTVTSVDGTTHDITVTIEGTNDKPMVTAESYTGHVSGHQTRSELIGGLGAVREDGSPTEIIDQRVQGVVQHLTSSGTLTATDVDNPQGDLSWRIVGSPRGAYGSLTVDPHGHWSYTLDNASPGVQKLATGMRVNDTFTVEVSDGHGGTQQTQVYVGVSGTNDAPVISVGTGDSDHGAVTEDAAKTTVSGSLTVTDVDVEPLSIDRSGGVTTVTSGSALETWAVDPKTPGTYGTLSVDQNGHWTYTLDNSRPETQALAAGHTVHETFTVTVTDSHQATTTHTVTIDVTGAGEGAQIGGVDTATVTEDRNVAAGHLTTGGTLTITDADPGEAAFTPVTSGAGHYGTFTVDAQGHWTYSADNNQAAVQQLAPGQHLTETLTVTSVDGTTHDITVTIEGTNDNPVITSGTNPRVGGQGQVTEDGSTTAVAGASGSHASSAAGLTASGTLTATDVDNASGDLTWHIVGSPQGRFGTLAVDAKTGQWAYALDNASPEVQKLAEVGNRSEAFKVEVTDGHGGTTETYVYVKIVGTNDAPVISVGTGDSDHGAVTEDAAKTTVSGSLTVTDVDVEPFNIDRSGGVTTVTSGPAIETWAVDPKTPGTYGTLSIDQNGHWTYTLDNARPETQALAAGHTVHETFTVTVTDSHQATTTHTVTIDVTGTDDAPQIAGSHVGTVVEGGPQTASGQLTATDVDTGDTAAWSIQGTGQGTYGTLAVDPATGQWTYTLDPTLSAPLKASETQHELFTVRVTDGAGGHVDQQIDVTVTGSNTAAVISGVDHTTVEEDHGTGTGGALETGGTLTIVDPDGAAAFTPVTGTAGAGQYGNFTVDAQGHWTYSADNSQAAVQQLGPGQSVTDHLQVRSVDGTTHEIRVTIQGHIDTPTVGATVGTAVSAPGHAVAEVVGAVHHETMQSTGFALHSFSFGEAYETAAGTLVDVTARPGEIGVGNQGAGAGVFGVGVDQTRTLHGPLLTAHDGTSSFTLDTVGDPDRTHHDPQMGETLVVELQGQSRSAMVTLNGFGGKGDALKWTAYDAAGHPVATGEMSATDATNPSSVGLLSIESKTPFAYVAIRATTPPEYTEAATGHTAQFTTGFGIAQVQAELIQYRTALTLQGTVGDPGDGDQSLSWRIEGLHQGSLSAGTHNPDGSWTVTAGQVQGLSVLHAGAQQITVTAIATDAGTGETAHSQPQAVTLDPSGAHYTVITGVPVVVTDENSPTPLTGDFNVDTDKGTPPNFVSGDQAGQYGAFHINSDGTWTYQLDTDHAQEIGSTGFKETFHITTTDGTAKDLTVMIIGDNDQPVVVDKDGAGVRAPAPVVGGHLAATDVDSPGSFMFTAQRGQTIAGQYGTATVDLHSGAWTYTVDPAKVAAIPAGQTPTEAFTFNAVGVQSHQRGAITVQVAIDSSGKATVVTEASSFAKGEVTEDKAVDHGNLVATGTLAGATAGDHLAGSHTGTYGSFTLTDNGHWTYSADNSQAAVQHLGAGEHLTDTLTLTSPSGQTFAVSITINGTDDAPQIAAVAIGPPPPPEPAFGDHQLHSQHEDPAAGAQALVTDNAADYHGAGTSFDHSGPGTTANHHLPEAANPSPSHPYLDLVAHLDATDSHAGHTLAGATNHPEFLQGDADHGTIHHDAADSGISHHDLLDHGNSDHAAGAGGDPGHGSVSHDGQHDTANPYAELIQSTDHGADHTAMPTAIDHPSATADYAQMTNTAGGLELHQEPPPADHLFADAHVDAGASHSPDQGGDHMPTPEAHHDDGAAAIATHALDQPMTHEPDHHGA